MHLLTLQRGQLFRVLLRSIQTSLHSPEVDTIMMAFALLNELHPCIALQQGKMPLSATHPAKEFGVTAAQSIVYKHQVA